MESIPQALDRLYLGQVLAYPTEAVYGLGCDAFNQQAVERILAIKQRSVTKGLIVLIAEWPQLLTLTDTLSSAAYDRLSGTWPGFTTWLCPKATSVPRWLSGDSPYIAIRMTAHPVARQLCALGPIVSTSANRQGQEPARSLLELEPLLQEDIDGVVPGTLGDAAEPSAIYDLSSGKRLR